MPEKASEVISVETPNLDFLFYPKSVAVIGASNVPGKVGNAIMRSITLRFDGRFTPSTLRAGD